MDSIPAIKTQKELVFEEETHLYTVKDELVSSVTQLMTQYGIIDTQWYNEQAKVRGKRVHLAAQFYDEGDLDEKSLDAAVLAYFTSYKRFRLETSIQRFLAIETPLYDQALWYGGTPDRVAIINDRVVLYDIKTGYVPTWAPMQLAAYKYLLKKSGVPVQDCFILNLKPMGNYRWIKTPLPDVMNAWGDFEAILKVERLPAKYNGRQYNKAA